MHNMISAKPWLKYYKKKYLKKNTSIISVVLEHWNIMNVVLENIWRHHNKMP